MAKTVVALENAPQLTSEDLRKLVDKATKGGPTAKDTIAKHLSEGRQEADPNEVVQQLPARPDPRVDPREVFLTAGESRDFNQALSMWLMGEALGGREQPDHDTQGRVRAGLVDTLMGQRVNQGGAFMQFLGM